MLELELNSRCSPANGYRIKYNSIEGSVLLGTACRKSNENNNGKH